MYAKSCDLRKICWGMNYAAKIITSFAILVSYFFSVGSDAGDLQPHEGAAAAAGGGGGGGGGQDDGVHPGVVIWAAEDGCGGGAVALGGGDDEKEEEEGEGLHFEAGGGGSR